MPTRRRRANLAVFLETQNFRPVLSSSYRHPLWRIFSRSARRPTIDQSHAQLQVNYIFEIYDLIANVSHILAPCVLARPPRAA